VSADWFVLVIITGGLIMLLQVSTGTEAIPVQTLARLIFALQVVLAFLSGARPALPTHLAVALALFVSSAVLATGLSLAGAPQQDAWDSFLFMYGIAMCLPAYLVTRVTVSGGLLLKLYCTLVVGFGLLQALKQDLLLPDAYREKYGIVFERFVNGDVRVLGLFASPPRFAEFLVFIAVFLQHHLLSGKGRKGWVLPAYAGVMFVLFNTYSRSGYILWASTLLAQLLVARRSLSMSGMRSSLVRFYISLSLVGTVLVFLLARGIPADSSVADSTSLDARLGNWQKILSDMGGEGLLRLLFGTGRSAHSNFLEPGYFALDNLFLAILLYSGVVGLICFLGLAGMILSEGKHVSRFHSSKAVPMTSFLLGLLVEGIFVDNHNTVFLVEFVMIGFVVAARESGATDVEARLTTRTSNDGQLLSRRVKGVASRGQ